MNLSDIKNLASLQDIPLVFSYITGREIIDIIFVSIAIYIVLLFIKQTRSYVVLIVSLALIFLNIFSQDFNLALTRSILQPLSTLTFIIIAIVFQKEIRRFFLWITMRQKYMIANAHTISKGVSAEIAEALLHMAEKRIGGIVVFPGKHELDDLLEGGQKLNGTITKEILLSIFDSSSPGHDGAVIIEQDTIKLFGVHLPFARNYNFRKAGTRHRASAGITEDTDAIALVVSEERGTISIAREGVLERVKDEARLRSILAELTGESNAEPQGFWHYFIWSNVKTKIMAISIALILWITLFMQTGVIKKEFTVPLSFQLLPTTYEIDSKTGKTQISITLQGRNTDMANFDPTKIEIKIDAKNFTAGDHTLEINESMVSVPSYLSVVEIDPTEISISIREKNQPAPEPTEETPAENTE